MRQTLNPGQIENALAYLRQHYGPITVAEADEYALVLAKLYPGELIAALERLPGPTPEGLMEVVRCHRPVERPASNEFIRTVIDQARADLARA